jgi:predicted nucleic acid-binding protein
VTLLVDTSVWSLAFRRDSSGSPPEVAALRAALEGGDSVVTTGLILQELLQGFSGPRDRDQLAQLCIRHDLTLLTTDNDFAGVAGHASLRLWKPAR